MQNRYTSNARFLKQLIDSNNLGYIHEIDVLQLGLESDKRYYLNRMAVVILGRVAWNMMVVLFTQFSHFVDLLYWLLVI